MYQILYYGGSGLSILLIIVAAILFFKFNIPSIIGNLTGYSEKKQLRPKQHKTNKSSIIKIGKANHQNVPITAPLEAKKETELLMVDNGDTDLKYFEILQEITLIHTEEMIF